MSKVLHTTTATGDEIDAIIRKLEEPLDGVKRGHAVIALLSLAIHIMNPTISGEALQEALAGISQYMCLLIDGMEGNTDELGEVEKKLVN